MLTSSIQEIRQFAKQPEELLSVKEDSTVAEAATIMSDNYVGCLIVFDSNNRFVGLLSERDMISKVLATSLPEETSVKEIMTSGVISCDMNTTVEEAERLMAKHKIRHLPILENNKPVGMISSRDIIAYRLYSNKSMQTAAEQLAMLPAGLKSLEFQDVIELAINEVPKSFGAEKAVVYLMSNDGSGPKIYSNGCPHSHQELLEKDKMTQYSSSKNIIFETCTDCTGTSQQTSKLVIPLNIRDQCNGCDSHSNTYGFLCMCSFDRSSSGLEKTQLYKASLLQQILNSNLTNAKLYENYQDARRDSETDPLTGLGTRRVLEKVLKAECARSARYHRMFSIAIIDLDHFKEINDSFGHAVGDKALRKLAKILRYSTRETDIIIARYGGDEFVLVMPKTGLKGARVLLERIRRHARTISIPNAGSATISCGLTEWNDRPADTPDTIMNRADEALYEAKRDGRDCVVAYKAAEGAKVQDASSGF